MKSGKPPARPPKKTAGKKKRRKKFKAVDKIHIVIAAAVLIAAGFTASALVVYFRSAELENEIALNAAPPDRAGPEAETGRDTAPLSAAKEPEPPDVSAESPPAGEAAAPVKKPPAKKPPAAPKERSAAGKGAAPSVVPPSPAKTETAPARTPAPAVKTAAPVPENRAAPAGTARERPPEISRGTLVFVIDDAGHNLRDLEPFLNISGPLTVAVLPGLPYSAEAARRIRAAGKEVFLHQPMESLGGHDPGPGAIRAGMSGDEVRAVVSRNLDELWPVAGMNNHEGSRITMDEKIMETVIALCRERGILFLDSRTTAETAAPEAARRLGTAIAERDVFVDNVQDRDSMAGYINTGLAKAEQKGSAIMIGHVWSPALAPLLAEFFPLLRKRGFSFSAASGLAGSKQKR